MVFRDKLMGTSLFMMPYNRYGSCRDADSPISVSMQVISLFQFWIEEQIMYGVFCSNYFSPFLFIGITNWWGNNGILS